jgi:hypothetical protein
MTSPIPNCPQPETPIRERAWTEGQKTEAMRAQFEAKLGSRVNLKRSKDGYYVVDYARGAWQGYQAALSSPAVVALVEALRAADGLAVCCMAVDGYSRK